MHVAGSRSTAGAVPRVPWFDHRPRLALVVVAALFIAVLAVRLLFGTPVDAFSMLYVLPIALAATAFGQRGGVLAAVCAVALIAVWVVVRDVSLGLTGWSTRAAPILLLGFLLGRATDRARRADAERRRLEVAALLHREAIEINDSLIQQMTAAKWLFEAGKVEGGLDALGKAVREAQQLVSGLIRRADIGERSAAVSLPSGLATPAQDLDADQRRG